MTRRWAMAKAVTVILIIVVKTGIAQEHNVTDESSTIIGTANILPVDNRSTEIDPIMVRIRQAAFNSSENSALQKRETGCEQPRVMQPYSVATQPLYCASSTDTETAEYKPHKGNPNCVRAFLVDQLRETNDNIGRLLECLARYGPKKDCTKPKVEHKVVTEKASYHEPYHHKETASCERCNYELKQFRNYKTPKPYNQRERQGYTGEEVDTTRYSSDKREHKTLTFRKEYVKEESEEVDTNRYSSAKRFPSSSCEEEYESAERATTTTEKSRKKPKKTTTTSRMTTKKSTVKKTKKPYKKPSSRECQCLYCAKDSSCPDSD